MDFSVEVMLCSFFLFISSDGCAYAVVSFFILNAVGSVFNHLLDDTPLPANEASSSVLVATYSHTSTQNGKGMMGGVKPVINGEVEKGLLTLIASDNPGLQVTHF